MDNAIPLINREGDVHPKELIDYLRSFYYKVAEPAQLDMISKSPDILVSDDMPYGMAYIENDYNQWTIAFNHMPYPTEMWRIFTFFSVRERCFLHKIILHHAYPNPKVFDVSEDRYGEKLGQMIVYIAQERAEEWDQSREAGRAAERQMFRDDNMEARRGY